MFRFLAFFSCILFSGSVFSQQFNGPESIEWDPVNNGWLVSNPAPSGQILSCDAQGNIISVFATPGDPYGTEVLHDTVYVCNDGHIKGYNLHDGTEVMDVNLSGGFLNGLTTDGDRSLFVTDFSNFKIFRVDVEAKTFNELVSTDVKPNGVVYDGDNDRLVYVEWASGAEIRAVSLIDSTESLLATTSTASIDGITMDDNGNWFFSPWSPGSLQMYNNDFSVGPTVVLSNLGNPADIDFSSTTDSVAVPNTASNSLSFYHSADSGGTGIAAPTALSPMRVWPVPADAFTTVQLRKPLAANGTVSIVDVKGSVVVQANAAAGTTHIELELTQLTPGAYWVRLAHDATTIATQAITVRH